jgi:hypothetical protein
VWISVSSLIKKRFEEINHKKTDFAEDIVNVAMMFCEPFGELVVLFRERPDIDATERVRLRERQREREARAAAGWRIRTHSSESSMSETAERHWALAL